MSFSISCSLLKLMSIKSVMPFNHLILWCPLLPSFFASIKVFSMSQLFTSGSKGIGASASASVFPVIIQSLLRLGLTGLISLLFKGQSRVFSSSLKASILHCLAFCMVQLSHLYQDYWKNHSFDYTDLCQQSHVSAF